MKWILGMCFSFLFVGGASAGISVNEAPVKGYGDPVTVAVSSDTLTKVPTSQTSGRFGIMVNNPSTNGGDVVGFMGDCTSTAFASTIRPFVIDNSSDTAGQYISMREDVCLWLRAIYTGAATTSIHYQELKQ